MQLDDGRRCGFVQVHAGAEVPDSKFIQQPAHFYETAVHAVERMIVGQRDDVEARGCHPTDHFRRSHHPRLGRHLAAVAGEGELQIGQQHVGFCKDRANRGRNQAGITTVGSPIGTFAEQQVADGGKTCNLLWLNRHAKEVVRIAGILAPRSIGLATPLYINDIQPPPL